MCNLRRSHDIDVVERYSDLAISFATTTVGDIVGNVGVLGTVGGVPIFGNAIG